MDLLGNPFYVLTASTRDNRRRIMELADERALMVDSSESTQARSDLTNPRKRLTAEMAWLLGVGPKKITEILFTLESCPSNLIELDGLTALTRSNLLVAGFIRLAESNTDTLSHWIQEIAKVFDEIDSEELVSLINEERITSGFPEVSNSSVVDTEIKERQLYYRKSIKSVLSNLTPQQRTEVITLVVESSTEGGEGQGPILISDLVDSYEIDVQVLLDTEKGKIQEKIELLLESIRSNQPDAKSGLILEKLKQAVESWDNIAQPIQVSAKSRGLDHDSSVHIAGLIRELALELFNEHDKLDFAQQLTDMLLKVFAEVGKVTEQGDQDAEVLSEIAESRKVNRLLSAISELNMSAFDQAEKHPSVADAEAQKVIDTAPTLISNLVSINPPSEIIDQGKDEIALTIIHCAVSYGNSSEKWDRCFELLQEALKYAKSEQVKVKLHENLGIVRENNRLSATKIERGSTSGWKWFMVLITIALAAVLYNVEKEDNAPSYNPQPSYTSTSQKASKTVVQTPRPVQSKELQFVKPSRGTNKVLSTSEIRWCIREGIRIEAMRRVFSSKEGVNRFNVIVSDANSRCGSFRYAVGALARAERDVEPLRRQIVAQAVRRANQLDSSYESPTSLSLDNAIDKASSQSIREAQSLLKALGYSPGAVDGKVGSRTVAAVKAFQSDAKAAQDGKIDDNLLSMLQEKLAVSQSDGLERSEIKVSQNDQPSVKSDENQGWNQYIGKNRLSIRSDKGAPTRVSQHGSYIIWHYTDFEVYINKSNNLVTEIRKQKLKQSTSSIKPLASAKPTSKVVSKPANDLVSSSNNLSIKEKSSLEVACSTASYKGPAAYQNCISKQLKQLVYAPPLASTKHLSAKEKSSLNIACSTASSEGPAAFRNCISDQLKRLASAPPLASTSHLSTKEKSSLNIACSTASSEGPAAFRNCISDQLKRLASAPPLVSTSHLSTKEKSSLNIACSTASSEGPAAYRNCINGQLKRLASAPPLAGTSHLSAKEKSSLSIACSTASSEGPASYRNCVRHQLKQVN